MSRNTRRSALLGGLVLLLAGKSWAQDLACSSAMSVGAPTAYDHIIVGSNCVLRIDAPVCANANLTIRVGGEVIIGAGLLVIGPNHECDDYNNSTVDFHLPSGACQHAPVSCDDHDLCTVDQWDSNWNCIHPPNTCDDRNGCTSDTCDRVLGCQHAPTNEGRPCDDQDVCTTGTSCSNGVCGGVLQHIATTRMHAPRTVAIAGEGASTPRW